MKCWNDNRGLGEIFALGIKEGIKKGAADCNMKSSYPSKLKLVGDIDEQKVGPDDFEEDTPALHRVEREWNKGKNPPSFKKHSQSEKSFQKPPAKNCI